eukprot:1867580-Prymnesium_polylepis.1
MPSGRDRRPPGVAVAVGCCVFINPVDVLDTLRFLDCALCSYDRACGVVSAKGGYGYFEK